MKTSNFWVTYKQDTAWQMHKLHFHESMEILLVLSEGGQLFAHNVMYPLHKNTLLILKENTLHRTTGESDLLFSRYVVHVMPSVLKYLSTQDTDFISILRNGDSYVQLTDEQANTLIRHIKHLQDGFQNHAFGADIRRMMSLAEILLFVSSCISDTPPQFGEKNPDYEKVIPILDYIQKHYKEQFTIDELATRFHLSKYYLCHIFKKGTGFSVMEYVIQMRILEAQRLLRHGHSVQEAGDGAGFQSYAHFIRTFNTYIGTSPKQYAKQYSRGEMVEN